MAIDDERCEIARRLRDAVGRLIDMGGLAEILGFHRCSWSAGMLADRLADLIEPEPERTCHMRDAHWDDGQCTWGCICSECGAKHEHKSGKWMNYCPNCGAKVVDE